MIIKVLIYYLIERLNKHVFCMCRCMHFCFCDFKWIYEYLQAFNVYTYRRLSRRRAFGRMFVLIYQCLTDTQKGCTVRPENQTQVWPVSDPTCVRPESDLSQTWVRHKSDTCQTCVRPVWTFSSYSIWQSVGYFVWTSAHGSTGIICYHSTRKCFITNCKGRVGCILFGETAANILNTSVV
jgi:hypothetical protein